MKEKKWKVCITMLVEAKTVDEALKLARSNTIYSKDASDCMVSSAEEITE